MVAPVRLARRPVMLRWLTGEPIMKAPPCKNNTAPADPAVDLERTISVGTPPRPDREKRTPNGTLSVRVAMLTQSRCTGIGKLGCSAGLRQLLTVNRASLAGIDSRMTFSSSSQLNCGKARRPQAVAEASCTDCSAGSLMVKCRCAAHAVLSGASTE